MKFAHWAIAAGLGLAVIMAGSLAPPAFAQNPQTCAQNPFAAGCNPQRNLGNAGSQPTRPNAGAGANANTVCPDHVPPGTRPPPGCPYRP